MANEEAFTLDSLALNDGTTFAVTSVSWPPPRQRQDWIGAADSEAQLLVRNPLHENRKVTLRILVVPQSTMDLALAKIAQVLDKLQKASQYTDGIGLVWTPATSTLSCTFDVLSGEITDLPIDWENGWLAKSPEFTIELTCKPYWRGTETLTSTASSSTPYVEKEITGVTGDVPALGRLIVTDTASQSRRHVEWGLEGPLTYNASTSLLIDSDNMVTSGFGGSQTTQSGAYDPNASGNSVILAVARTSPTAMCGTGNLSHVGAFRVKGRFYASTGTSVRLVWQAGDGPVSSNPWVVTPSTAGWAEIDLGQITIPVVVSGTQRWTGRVEIKTSSGTNNTYLDYMVLVPLADGYGKSRAAYSYIAGALVGFDDFTGTTATSALNARVAPAGGTWATSGDATDYTFADDFGEEQIVRSAASSTSGRFAILGTTNYTDTDISARVRVDSASPTQLTAALPSVVARYVDSSNYLRASLMANGAYLELTQVVAGVATTVLSAAFGYTTLVFYKIQLVVYAGGRAIATIYTDAGASLTSVEMSTTALATSGTLASGKVGLRDYNSGASSAARYYDNVTMATPAAEPIVVYSGRNMQIRHDDVIRQDSTGTYTGRPQSYKGTRFMVPVGTSRVMVKARRNDVETAADDNVTDATQIQIGWTPRGLAVPR